MTAVGRTFDDEYRDGKLMEDGVVTEEGRCVKGKVFENKEDCGMSDHNKEGARG